MQAFQTQPSRTRHIPAALTGLSVVSISYGDRSFGLYRVKQIEARTMLLGHGAISFPVGMHLDIEDYKYQIPNHASFHQRATVVENTRDGIRLVW
jgi:hypothetical protein